LLIVALTVTGAFVYSARHELIEALGRVSLAFVALVYVATLVQNIIMWLVFHESAGAGNDYIRTCRMHFGGQVAKYVPGKIWALVYQGTLKSSGMPMGNIVQGNIVVYALGVLSVVVASTALLVQEWSRPIAAVLVIGGAVVAAYLMSSDHLYRIVQRLSRLSKRTELTEHVPATHFSLATRVGAYTVLLVSYVLSNVFLLYAFFDFELMQVLRLTAYLGIAWLAGVIVAVSPSGLGVREAAFVGIGYLTGENSFEILAGIAIVARAIQILQDLVSAFLVPAVVGFLQNKNEPGAQKPD
jgi:hypothetical protein